jgi:hypothetical protein
MGAITAGTSLYIRERLLAAQGRCTTAKVDTAIYIVVANSATRHMSLLPESRPN